MKRTISVLIAVTICCSLASPRAAAPIAVMILDGESGGPYHRWQGTTPVLKTILAETGLFTVDVSTAPATTGELTGFSPTLSGHGAIVLNYDAPDDRWPAALKTAFENYVRDGGGLVIVHAADNAFPGWKAYNEMIGVGGWRNRNENAGPHWFVKDGALASDPAPGPAGSHGLRTPFLITVRDASHPILRGLPPPGWH